jgi:nitrite reductase/ring-hydroxylating ferredoxin subunit
MAKGDTLRLLAEWRLNSESDRSMMPMPSAMYVSDDVAESEKCLVFRDEWICVGHEHEISEPGSFLTFEQLDQPLLIVRNLEGALRAFSNVCPHRSSRIAEGRGRTRLLVCPYHAWSYDLDGNLKSAPFMEPAQVDGICLRTVLLESWEGMLFVNLDSDAEPLAPRLSSLKAFVGPFDIADRHVIHTFDDEFDCNWKVLVENFCESYHVFKVHKTTLEPETPTSSVEVLQGDTAFNHHTMDYRSGGEGLVSKDHLFCIYPATVMAVSAQIMIWLTVLPLTAGRSAVRGWLAKPAGKAANGDDVRADIERTDAFLAEDKRVVAGVQQGLVAGTGNRGPLNAMEKTNWQFAHYLAGKLLDR